MKPTDLAYMAGLLDGEGSFLVTTINWHWDGFIGPVRRAVIECAMTDRGPLDKLRTLLGGHIAGPYKTSGFSNARLCWHWSLQTQAGVTQAIRLLRPYLVLKRPQAALVLRYLHWRRQQKTSRYARLKAPKFLEKGA